MANSSPPSNSPASTPATASASATTRNRSAIWWTWNTTTYAPPCSPIRPRGRRSETLARILWAVPWIVFAVVIVAAGGGIFAAAMVGLAWAAQIEFFRMTARSRPFEAAAFLITLGMIAAAFFGGSFQILLALVSLFPVMLIFNFGLS